MSSLMFSVSTAIGSRFLLFAASALVEVVFAQRMKGLATVHYVKAASALYTMYAYGRSSYEDMPSRKIVFIVHNRKCTVYNGKFFPIGCACTGDRAEKQWREESCGS